MTTDHELPGEAQGLSWAQPEAPAHDPGDPGSGADPAGPHRPRRRHRLAAAAVGLAVVGVAAASGSAVARPQLSLSMSQIAAKVGPALVDVDSTLGYEHAAAAGTGLVLTSRGEVLTNNHVVEGATSIKVTDVGNGQAYRAVVVGYDRTHDIAVLQMIGASKLKTVTLGNSSAVAAAQRVVALGNAGGKGGKPSVAAGRVVSLGESITATDAAAGTSEQLSGLIHTNAPIQPGDSGGPLVNAAGQVIAINTAASDKPQFRFQASKTHTQAFAIPIAQARSIARQIEAHRSSATVHIGASGFLGVQIMPVSESAASGPGAVIAGVLPGSPAARAGLSAGDVIGSVAGHSISSPSGLQSAIGRYHPGDRIKVGWTDSSGLSHSATVTLVKGPVG